MYCKNCGISIENDALFCPGCGEKFSMENNATNNESASLKVNQKNKKIIKIVIAIFVVAIIAVVGIFISTQYVSANKYINDQLEFSGFNGYGKVSSSFEDIVDYDGLSNALFDSSSSGLGNMLLQQAGIYSYISIELDDYKNLSNGDTVSASITIDYDSINHLSKCKHKLYGSDVIKKEYTVSGLEEGIVIDPFEAVKSVVIDKTDDNYGKIILDKNYKKTYSNLTFAMDENRYGISVYNNGEVIEYLSYECNEEDKEYNNGDEVSISLENNESVLEKYGIVLSPSSKTYKCQTYDYLTDINDLKDKSVLEKYKTEAVKESSVYPSSFEKAYFALAGSTSELKNDSKNMIIFLVNETYGTPSQKFYYSYCLENVKINEETGELVEDDLSLATGTRECESIEKYETEKKPYWVSFNSFDI